MKHKQRNALVGMVVMKVGVPMARKMIRKKAKGAAAGAVGHVGRHPKRVSVAPGAVAGAAAWAVTRRRGADTEAERSVDGDSAGSGTPPLF